MPESTKGPPFLNLEACVKLRKEASGDSCVKLPAEVIGDAWENKGYTSFEWGGLR